MSETMTCAYCGKSKQCPDGFPRRNFAQCWECAWDAHVHGEHRKVIRRIRREARKRARRLKERDLVDAMFDSEKRQVLGPDYRNATATTTSPGAEEAST